MKKPKIMSVLMLLAMTFVLGACGNESESEPEATSNEPLFTEGTYSATENGFNGPLTVEVTVDENTIKEINLKESVETDGLGDVAFEKISSQVLEGQTLKVDTATGATVSAAAIKSAIKNALEQADGDVTALGQKEYTLESKDQVIETDVVVIGSGAAGLSAAIEAAQGGADVVILEKLSRTGGSTRISSGMVVVGGSKLQAEAGIEDSVEKFENYMLERGAGNVDEEMVNYVAENANDALDFLMDMGISYSPEGIVFSGTADVERAHVPATYGVEFVDQMVERAESLGVEIYTDTPAESLIQEENGKIVGVNATKNGAKFTVNSEAVIIATGGFDQNEELKEQYAPEAAGAWAVSAPQNTGDGLLMGMEVGADTVFKGGFIGWKVVSPAYGHTTKEAQPIYGLPNLIVDTAGNRFTDESEDYPFLYQAMTENGDDKFYFIFDANAGTTDTLEASTATIDSLEAAVEAGVAFKADTIEELAEISELTNLLETSNRYNEMIENGTDEDFGRNVETMSSLKSGPFYAIQSQKATLGTFGGLKVNIPGEVLDENGQAIAGLYAAGEVANGDFFGDTYPASGTAISMSVIFGREAGQSAAKYVK